MPKVSKEYFRYGDRDILTDIMYTSAKGFFVKDSFLAETLRKYMDVEGIHSHTSETVLRSDMRRAIKWQRDLEEQCNRVLLVEFYSSGRLYWVPGKGGHSHQGSGNERGKALSPGTAGMVLSWNSYFVKEWEGAEAYFADNDGNIGHRVGTNIAKDKIRIPYDKRAIETLEKLATGLDNMCCKMFEFLNTPELMLQAPVGLKQLL